MCRKQYRPLLGKLSNLFPNSYSFFGIKTCCRFIQNNDSGIAKNGLRYQNSLFHSTGITSYCPICHLLHIHIGKNPVNFFRSLCFPYSFQTSHISQKTATRKRVIKPLLLRCITQQFSILFPHMINLSAFPKNLSLICPEIHRQQIHQCRFSGPIWSQKTIYSLSQ